MSLNTIISDSSNGKDLHFLCGIDRIIKYYLEEMEHQRIDKYDNITHLR
jgi:hypothetical protein